MKYIDLHTDALTKTEGVLQVSRGLLEKGGCLLQCFAIFLEGPHKFERALRFAERFDAMCAEEGYHPVCKASDIKKGEINAMLTLEDGGMFEGDLAKIEILYHCGVRMATLTWNYPNELGYPNLRRYSKWKKGEVAPIAEREGERGLTRFGREVVQRMGELGMIVDVSHGSDKLFFDVAKWSKAAKIPFVASHSCAAKLCSRARNLTDEQIRTVADCGGVIGLNFCADFIGEDRSLEGQRTALLAHARHVLKVGGEEVLALGSDFDGIPENPYMKNAAAMPELLADFSRTFGEYITEKIAYKNALRVLRAGLGG